MVQSGKLPPGSLVRYKAAAVPERLPPEASDWRLTGNAEERARALRFKPGEVLAAVLLPDVTRPSDRGDEFEVRQRGDCQVTVLPQLMKVVSVADANPRGDTRVDRATRHRARPVPEPEPERLQRKAASTQDITRLTERVKGLSGKPWVYHGKDGPPEDEWDSPFPKEMTPRLLQHWMADVVLPRLRRHPMRWAVIAIAPTESAAPKMAAQIQSKFSGMEIQVRSRSIRARWTQGSSP